MPEEKFISTAVPTLWNKGKLIGAKLHCGQTKSCRYELGF